MPAGGEMKFVTNSLANTGEVEVRFIDSGTGIADDAREHLFEPMWTTKKSGSGLGLAIAREIVVEHGGQIECVMEVRRGAEFRVVLPAIAMVVASELTGVSLDAA